MFQYLYVKWFTIFFFCSCYFVTDYRCQAGANISISGNSKSKNNKHMRLSLSTLQIKHRDVIWTAHNSKTKGSKQGHTWDDNSTCIMTLCIHLYWTIPVLTLVHYFSSNHNMFPTTRLFVLNRWVICLFPCQSD